MNLASTGKWISVPALKIWLVWHTWGSIRVDHCATDEVMKCLWCGGWVVWCALGHGTLLQRSCMACKCENWCSMQLCACACWVGSVHNGIMTINTSSTTQPYTANPMTINGPLTLTLSHSAASTTYVPSGVWRSVDLSHSVTTLEMDRYSHSSGVPPTHCLQLCKLPPELVISTSWLYLLWESWWSEGFVVSQWLGSGLREKNALVTQPLSTHMYYIMCTLFRYVINLGRFW